jgi:hypothetical protein
VPRRTRAQVQIRRKRTPPPASQRAAPEANDAPPSESLSVDADAATNAPYVRRRPVQDAAPSRDAAAARAPVRQARALVTDYGFVLAELEKVGYTFAVLILLLVVIARLLR